MYVPSKLGTKLGLYTISFFNGDYHALLHDICDLVYYGHVVICSGTIFHYCMKIKAPHLYLIISHCCTMD